MPPNKAVHLQLEESLCSSGDQAQPNGHMLWSKGIFLRLQIFFNIYKLITLIYHINKMKNKNYMIISIDTEKTWQNPTLIWLILSRKCTKRTYLNTVKAIYDKPTATSCSRVKSGKHFLYHQKQDKDVHSQHSYSTVLEVLTTAIREEKETKGIQIRKQNKTKKTVTAGRWHYTKHWKS